MRIVKIFLGAIIMIALIDELIDQDMYGNDREGLIKIGMLMIFEIWLLGG